MMLNAQQIKDMRLISSGFDENHLRPAGYDLRVQTLMNKDEAGAIKAYTDDVELKPSGIAAVVSKEVISLPKTVCAYASVKTSLCREGILAMNTGIVDPGWDAPISSLMLNFGKNAYRLREGDSFIRLTFHTVEPWAKTDRVTIGRANYESDIESKFDKRLGALFMDFGSAVEEAEEHLVTQTKLAFIKWAPIGGLILSIIFTLMTFAMNAGTLKIGQWLSPSNSAADPAKSIKDLENRVTNDETQNAALRKELDQLRQQLTESSRRR